MTKSLKQDYQIGGYTFCMTPEAAALWNRGLFHGKDTHGTTIRIPNFPQPPLGSPKGVQIGSKLGRDIIAFLQAEGYRASPHLIPFPDSTSRNKYS